METLTIGKMWHIEDRHKGGVVFSYGASNSSNFRYAGRDIEALHTWLTQWLKENPVTPPIPKGLRKLQGKCFNKAVDTDMWETLLHWDDLIDYLDKEGLVVVRRHFSATFWDKVNSRLEGRVLPQDFSTLIKAWEEEPGD